MDKGKVNNIKTACIVLVLSMGLLLTGCGEKKRLEKELVLRTEGIQQLEQGGYEEAVELFQQALEQHKGEYRDLEEDISLYLAQAQSSMGNIVDAVAVYTDLLEQEKGSREVYYLRGSAYLKLGDEESALQDFASVAEELESSLNKEEGAAEDASKMYELLGLGALQAKEYDRALEYFEKGLACETVTNKDGLWSGKIAALEFTGDFEQAKFEMEQYVAEYPEDEHAQREYLFLKTR